MSACMQHRYVTIEGATRRKQKLESADGKEREVVTDRLGYFYCRIKQSAPDGRGVGERT